MKTLGIKFQVAGVKEAQAGLNSYKNSLNQSLQQNKQAVQQSLKDANRLSVKRSVRGRRQEVAVDYQDQEIISAYRVAPKKRKNPGQITPEDRRVINDASNQAISRYGLENKDQNIVDGVAQGTKEGLEEFNSKLDTLTSESQANLNKLQTNFSRSIKDSFISSKAKEINTGFYGGIGQEAGRQTFVGVQNLIRSFLGLEEQRETVNISDKSIALLAGSIGAVVKTSRFTISDLKISVPKLIEKPQDKSGQKTGLINSLLMPFRTVKYGFFEGIGASFGHQYAKGFGDILNSKLDIDFERKGQVGGMTAFHVKETGVPEFIKNIKETSDLFEKFDLNLITSKKDLTDFSNLIKQFSKTATSLPSSVITGYRKGSVEIEGLRKLQKLADEIKDEDLPDLAGKKRLVQVIGGFAAEEGRSGFRMAEELKNSASDDTAVTGVSNKETDLTFSVFGNKALWGANLVQKIVDLNLKGYNTDSVKMAAQVLAILKKYPDLEEIRISGHSAGGFNVEEVQEMLDLLKQASLLSTKTKITTIASGTPQTIGGLNNPNTQQILGDRDDIIKDVEKVGEFLGVVKPRSETELKGVASHYGGDYLVAEDYLKALLGDGFDKEKNKELRKSRSPFKGQLIEIEQLYLKYLAAFDQDLDELIDELSIAPDRLVAKARKAKISGKPREKAITKLNTRDFERFNLQDATKTAVVVVNGFGGDGGNSGVQMANGLAKMTNDRNVQFFGAKNPHTDTLTREQLEGEDLDKVAEIATKHVAKLFYEAHALGVNQDAIEIAAQTLDLQQQNPDLEIKLLGNSFGGYIVEDVIALLKAMGADMKRIKAIAVGTPELPGGIKNKQLKQYLGDNDGVFNVNQVKAINKRAKDLIGFELFPDLSKKDQNLPNINIHDLQEYIEKSPEIKEFVFGLQNSIDELLEIEQQIQDKSDQANNITDAVESLRNNPNLSGEDKIRSLLELRDKYIATLQDIVILSEKAKKLGGGRRFTQQGKKAAKQLDELTPKTQRTSDGADGALPVSSPTEQKEQPVSTPAPEPVPEPVTTNSTVDEDPWSDEPEPEFNIKAAVEGYQNYLRNLIKQSEANTKSTAQIVKADFKNLTKDAQVNYLQSIRAVFNIKARLFRDAVKSGQLEIAREQGEQLVKLAALMKNLYGEIDQDGEIDAEVRSSLTGYSRYATSVQNEVIGGSGARGRSEVGLTQAFEEQLNLSQQDGANISEGFIYGILENLAAARDAGEQLVDEVDRGIRDRGKIESPSKLAKQLGKWFAQGFGLGMAAENLEAKGEEIVEKAQKGVKDQFKKRREEIAELQNNLSSQNIRQGLVGNLRKLFNFSEGKYQDIKQNHPEAVEKAKEVKARVKGEVNELKNDVAQEFSEELTELENFIAEHQDKFLSDNIAKFIDASGAGIIKKIGSLIFDASQNEGFDKTLNTIADLGGKLFRLIITFKLLKVALDALGLGKLVEGFSNLPTEAVNAAIAVEALDKRIVDLSGSAQAGAKNLGFITAEAKRLNKSLTTAKENYSKIISSTKDTALEGFQAENIYTAFANTAKTKGLSSAEEERLFTAVQQIIGKQVLSQEEVRQQMGELLGDFPQTLAQAYGVSVPQLNKMIESGELLATDALPKVAAILNAKNGIAGEANTGAAAVQRLDNAIISFRENVGSVLLPMQKFGNNFLAGFFNGLGGLISNLKSLVNGFFLALFVNLLRLEIFGQSVQKILLGLIKLLWTMKGAIAIFAAEMAFIAAAWAVWSNVINQFRDRYFPQINKDIKQLTNGMKAYRQAIDEARGAQKNLGDAKLKLNEGVDLSGLPNWVQKTAGGDHLNWDNLVRDRWNGMIDRMDAYNYAASGGTATPLKGRTKTVRENKEEQLIIDNGNLSLKANQLLMESQEAFKAAEEITKYDAQIAEIQSARLKLLPGDQDALKASLEEEKKINKLRDKELKIVSSYQQTLTISANALKSRLEGLEQRFLNGEIDEPTYNQEKDNLEGLLTNTEDKLKAVNDELSRVSNRLSEFQRRLRNSNERVEGFLAQSDRELQQQKAGIIESGIESGTGNQVIQLELDSVQQQDLSRRIGFLKKEISAIEKDLQSPELEAATKRIKQNLAEKDIPLNETSLSRIIEESTVKADKEAAQGLLAQLKQQTQLSGLSEQLAQTLQQNRNALIDLSRSINDYLFRITQQIKEAQVEVLRIVNQIVQTSIRNKLQSALSPNSESFVNQLISSTQSLLDQAASYAEKVLGQKGARIQFAGQKRTLEMELQDFARNVSGASDALATFEARLRGGGSSSSASSQGASSNSGSNSFAQKTKEIAGRLGIDPHALMTIMLFESAGTLDPKIQGPQVGNDRNNRGRGLIQFMPGTARGLGTSDAALAAMTQLEQLDWVEKYFAQFKGNFGAGKLENLYAAVLAGDPRAVNASDGYTTARLGAQRMMSEYGAKATSLLGQSTKTSEMNVLNVPSVPTFTSSGALPPPPEIEQAKKDTEFLIDKEEQKLDLQDSLVNNQEFESLKINLDNTFKSDRRRVEAEIKERQFQLDDSIYAQFDLLSQYDYQTADTEAARNINSVNKAFSDRGREVNRQIQYYSDEIDALNEVIGQTESLLALAQTDEEKRIILENDANAKLLLPVYQENLAAMIEQEKELGQAAQTALGFVRDQNQLKKEQEEINKRTTLLNQRDAITQARGTLEQQRQLKLKQEEARLEQRINEIRLNTPPGVYRDEQILNELEQSKINKENINYDAEAGELDLERKLIDLDAGINEKKAGFLSRIGFNFKAQKLQRDSAIEQENNRYKSYLVQLEKEHKGDPEVLEKLKIKAEELNRVNLEAINQQFKDLKTTIEDMGISAIQGFFTQISTNFFDGKAEQDRALLEERLRYAEELVQLENQYKEEPGHLAHLKNRARELNEQKLDKINSEFNGFKRVINIAGQALLEFTKQLAAMAAQYAAAKFISSIFGSALGGIGGGAVSVGNDFGGGVGTAAFTASEGITVPNYLKGGRIVNASFSNKLAEVMPSLRSAFRREGSQGVLGVFTPGEEILSIKTGEAGRYQALKARYGVNPLAKIANYTQGGTIPDVNSSILSGFSSSRPRIDLSGLGEGRGQKAEGRRSVTINTTVVTPNADSFRLNQDQMNQDLVERMRRGI